MQLDREVESLGMRLGSFSGHNSFGIKMQLLPADVDFAIDLLSDFIEKPSFSDEDFAQEKKRLKVDIAVREDSVFHVASKHLRQMLFESHNFRLETLGTKETVENINKEDILAFYKILAVPNNMVVSVFGKFNSKEMAKVLERNLGGLKKGEFELITHQETLPEKIRKKTVFHDKEQAIVLFGFQAVDFYNSDRYGIDVLTAILGSSFQGRLFTKIRDELGTAYAVGGNFLPAADAGMIYFYVLTSNEYLERVKQVVVSSIDELRKEDVSAGELDSIKTYLKGTFKMGLQTSASLGFTAALDELYGLGYDNYKKYEEQIDKITVSDMKRLANEYLYINNAAIVTLQPEEKLDNVGNTP